MNGTSYDLHLKISAAFPGSWMRLHGLTRPQLGCYCFPLRDTEPLCYPVILTSVASTLRSQTTQGFGTWKYPKIGHTLTILRAQSSLGHCLWCSGVAAVPRTGGRERSWANESGKAKTAPEGRVQFPSPCAGTVVQNWGCCPGRLLWRTDVV